MEQRGDQESVRESLRQAAAGAGGGGRLGSQAPAHPQSRIQSCKCVFMSTVFDKLYTAYVHTLSCCVMSFEPRYYLLSLVRTDQGDRHQRGGQAGLQVLLLVCAGQ